MYAEKYASLQKKSAGINTNVRVHYNSEKPGSLQALAYTQGRHVYIGPGQEKHLEHELGHVIQQKQGLVKPNTYINGLPVNTDRSLEQQAESGAITFGKAVHESRQDIVQGVFLVYEDDPDAGMPILRECNGSDTKYDVDTDSINADDFFKIITHLKNAALIYKISDKLPSEKTEGRKLILDLVLSWGKNIQEILAAMSPSCLNWLKQVLIWFITNNNYNKTNLTEVKEADENRKKANYILSFFNNGALASNLSKDEIYGELQRKIGELGEKINALTGKKLENKERQAAKLVGWEIVGYQRLKNRFEEDDILQEQLKVLDSLKRSLVMVYYQNHIAFPLYLLATPLGMPTGGTTNRLSTYEYEKKEEVSLPTLAEIPSTLLSYPISRDSMDITLILLQRIFTYLGETNSSERLVIYRGMMAPEAFSILEFFYSGKSYNAERKIIKGKSININGSEKPAPLGKHYGDLEQAHKYITNQTQTEEKKEAEKDARVVLAFILKPGAKNLLFSKCLIALPENKAILNEYLIRDLKHHSDWMRILGDSLGKRYGTNLKGTALNKELNKDLKTYCENYWSGFVTASKHEGTRPGYIGIKYENANLGNIFSLAIGESDYSRLLLQILIDRVEIVDYNL